MRHYFLFLFMALPFAAVAQNNFVLRLDAQDFNGDSLIIGAPLVKMGFEDFYSFEMSNVTDLKSTGMVPFSSYYLKLSGKNTFKGKVSNPVPVALIHLDFRNNAPPKISDVFFLESGEYTIQLQELKHKQELNVFSPSNIEYKSLKTFLRQAYTKANNPFQVDSLIDFSLKKRLLSEYIGQHPDSYPAFWEIINDYSLYLKEKEGFEILNTFSNEFKKSRLFRKLEIKIEREDIMRENDFFPEVRFDNGRVLGRNLFGSYRISLIDYWSTTCGPCIASMPELVEIHTRYKEKGLNILAVADDKTAEAKERAGKLLEKNRIKWDNHFDDKDIFKSSVNANGYPLYFLIDNRGIIVYRGSDLKEVRGRIDKIIK